MSKKFESAILIVLLMFNGLTFSKKTEAQEEVELSNEEALVKVFEDSYRAFAFECVDSEGKEIAPSVLIEGKLEECQAKAKAVEELYNETKAKINDLDNHQIELGQCQQEGNYRSIEELIGSVADVSSRVSCAEEEQRSCMSDLGCNVARSLDGVIRSGGVLLSKLSDKIQEKLVESGTAKKSCFDQSNGNCIDELIGAFIGNLVSTGESLWTVAKSMWGFFSSGTQMIDTTVNNLHTAVTTSVDGVVSFNSNPLNWIRQKIENMMTSVKTWMKSEVFCQKWEGRPHASTCEQPMDSFDCLDCNDSLNAVCAAGGFAIAEMGIMAFTGGAGAVVSVGTKIALKGAAVGAARMSAMSAKAMAKIESVVPEIKMLKRRNTDIENDSRSKIKVFEMAQSAIKAFQKIDIAKMKETISLFSKEKIALAKANSKAFSVVADSTVVGAKVALKVASTTKAAIGKVKGVSDAALERAYSFGGNKAEQLMEKVTGGRLRITHFEGSSRTVSLTNGGIVVNNALGTKVTGTSARIVAGGRWPSSVRQNVREVGDDRFGLNRLQEQTRSTHSSSSSNNSNRGSDHSWEESGHSSQSSTSSNTNQNQNNNAAGDLIGQMAETNIGKSALIGGVGAVGEGIGEGVLNASRRSRNARRGSLLTAVSAGSGVVKGMRSNSEVENDQFGNELTAAEKNRMTKMAISKVLNSTGSVSFDRLSDDQRSIHRASQILGADANQILDGNNLEQRFLEQQAIFSDDNKENFTRKYAQTTGVSEEVARDMFETRQKELFAAKDYLQSYSRSLSESFASSSNIINEPTRANNIQNTESSDSRSKELEGKIAEMESSIRDLSEEANVVADDNVVDRVESINANPIGAQNTLPNRRAPSSVASNSHSSAGGALAPSMSAASYSGFSTSSVAPESFTSEVTTENEQLVQNMPEVIRPTENVDALVEDIPQNVSVLGNSEEEQKPRTSRAQTLSDLLNNTDRRLRIHQNEELPWSLAEIVKGVSDKEDQQRLAALVGQRAKYKKMEEFDGGTFKLHIIEFLSGDKMSVKVQGQSMEIIEMNSALELKNQILAK